MHQASKPNNAVVSELPYDEAHGWFLLSFLSCKAMEHMILQCDRKRPCSRCTQLGLVRLASAVAVFWKNLHAHRRGCAYTK
jgi:hypothetical protein